MGNNNKSVNITNIISHLQDAVNKSGEICKVNFTTKTEAYWSFYLKEGTLIWANENEHPLKRLYRVVGKFCPSVNCRELKLRESERSELWEYLVITVLSQRQKITIEQANLIIQEYIAEVLFDCFQNSENINKIELIESNSHNFMGAILRHPLLKEPLAKIDFTQLSTQVLKSWQNWQGAGLEKYSPNLALVLKNQEQLQKSTEKAIYQKLTLLVNGTRTIRDLSILTQKDPLAFINTFIPYINTDLMELRAIPDEHFPNQNSSTEVNQQSISTSNQAIEKAHNSGQLTNQPLIICIDDNPTFNTQIKKILEQEKYRVIVIEKASQALTTILGNKPNMIFLDLVMPEVNGYQICSQIRKLSILQNIPVVILTGNDSLLARTRAKMAGASDFLNKPIEADKIIAITHKYLKNYQDYSEKYSQLIQQEA